MDNKNSKSATDTANEKAQNPVPNSAEVLIMLDAMRRTEADQESRFAARMKEAVKEIEHESRIRWRVTFAAATIAAGVLAYFATAGISCVVHDKVNCEFDKYTKQQIDLRIESLSQELRGRIVECTNAVRKLDHQLHLLHLNSLALGGDVEAYSEIKRRASDDNAAKDCLTSVDAYYASLFHRRGPNSCMNEIHWDYRKVDLPLEEKLRRINGDKGLSNTNINLIISLVADSHNEKKFAGLLVRKAKDCVNLFDRTTLIDCLHALFDDCPRTPDIEKVVKWWETKKCPEYDAEERGK